MEAKGDQLMQEADAALKKFSFGALFGGGSEKYEDASDKYKRAADAYKASKKWSEAAKAFTAAAGCFKALKDEMEITQCFVEASRMLIKAGSPAEATALLEGEALPRMIDAGRLAQAAKLHEEVAKIFEDEHEYQQAIDNYTKAADLFSAENSAATASKAKQNAARLYAMLEPADYQKCCELYAECGAEAMASQLLKFGAKECFTRAVFCCLALNDAVTAKQNFDKFKEQDYTLEGALLCAQV
jgi:alpha-soluble NSF attachment protein